MGIDEIRVGTRVRVREDHRVKSRRGAVGKIMGRYGGREHVAVDVQLSDGRRKAVLAGGPERGLSTAVLVAFAVRGGLA